jgi:hypothetical protein
MLILDLQWHDYIGAFGAFLVVIAYFYLQIGKISGQDITFSVLNAIGSMLILISLSFNFNFSAVIIEVFWLIISLLGLTLGLKNLQRLNKE